MMPVDGCGSTFSEMAAKVLPDDMTRLRAAMATPCPMTEFCTPGMGVKSILSKLGRSKDFSGCYVLLDDSRAFYVGISRSVVQRLRQQGMGSTHFDASLAYSMASAKTGHEMTREKAMKNSIFMEAFDAAKALIRNSSVAFIEIENPLELYLFEAYSAMELETGEWNTFRTH